MSIDYNTFSDRLYRYFYHTANMPTNLCPYFWKVLIAYVLIVPYFILTLPTKQFKVGDCGPHDENSRIILVSFMGWFVFALLSSVIFTSITISLGYVYMTDGLNILGVIQSVGVAFIMAIIITSVSVLVGGIYKRIREYNYMKKYGKRHVEPKYNMFVAFIKAKYHNYCPQITWEQTDNQYITRI